MRGHIDLTNVDMVINVKDILENTLLRKIILVNDFEAIGYGLDLLDLEKDVFVLPHVGEDRTNSNILSNTFAVIGAGRGLGVSIAYYDLVRHMHVPLPLSLSMCSSPLLIFTRSETSCNPNPVPFSASVPTVVSKWPSFLNSSNLSFGIPTPESLKNSLICPSILSVRIFWMYLHF